MSEASREVQSLLATNYYGVLATQSKEVQGYPFGSVVPYCLDADGWPIILLSHLAQHYQNIQADPKVSLLVLASGCDDPQTAKRVTWVADAVPIATDNEAIIGRYYRFFPQLTDYHTTLGFKFFRLLPVRALYIAGFGKIRWYKKSELQYQYAFDNVLECNILQWFNAEPSYRMQYLQLLKLDEQQQSVALVGVDQAGCCVRVNDRVYRIDFANPVYSIIDIQQALSCLLGSKKCG